MSTWTNQPSLKEWAEMAEGNGPRPRIMAFFTRSVIPHCQFCANHRWPWLPSELPWTSHHITKQASLKRTTEDCKGEKTHTVGEAWRRVLKGRLLGPAQLPGHLGAPLVLRQSTGEPPSDNTLQEFCYGWVNFWLNVTLMFIGNLSIRLSCGLGRNPY